MTPLVITGLLHLGKFVLQLEPSRLRFRCGRVLLGGYLDGSLIVCVDNPVSQEMLDGTVPCNAMSSSPLRSSAMVADGASPVPRLEEPKSVEDYQSLILRVNRNTSAAKARSQAARSMAPDGSHGSLMAVLRSGG